MQYTQEFIPPNHNEVVMQRLFSDSVREFVWLFSFRLINVFLLIHAIGLFVVVKKIILSEDYQYILDDPLFFTKKGQLDTVGCILFLLALLPSIIHIPFDLRKRRLIKYVENGLEKNCNLCFRGKTIYESEFARISALLPDLPFSYEERPENGAEWEIRIEDTEKGVVVLTFTVERTWFNWFRRLLLGRFTSRSFKYVLEERFLNHSKAFLQFLKEQRND